MFEIIKKKLFRKPSYSLDPKNLNERFSQIYFKNIFGGNESRSGEGSNLVQTAEIRKKLPVLFEELGVQSVLDAPCGDWYWMKECQLKLDQYVGVDIVQAIIDNNQWQFGNSATRFVCLDLANDSLPTADLIFCRDCLVHLTFDDIKKVIANFKKSGAKYLLTTTFTAREKNVDLTGGDIWRTLNLQLSPFNFPPPLKLIDEKCTEYHGQYADKQLGLWKLGDL